MISSIIPKKCKIKLARNITRLYRSKVVVYPIFKDEHIHTNMNRTFSWLFEYNCVRWQYIYIYIDTHTFIIHIFLV